MREIDPGYGRYIPIFAPREKVEVIDGWGDVLITGDGGTVLAPRGGTGTVRKAFPASIYDGPL